MKHKLTSILALGLMVLLVVGLSLLLENWSVGGDYEHPASEALPTASIAPTSSYSELMTLAATDIWSIPTPIHTPIIPTERPRQPRPTPEPVTPYPTPTLLPDLGVRMSAPTEISISPTLRAAGEKQGRLVYTDIDGHILVGVVSEADYSSVVVVDISTGHIQTLVEKSPAWIHDTHISGENVIWTRTEYDGPLSVLYVHNLQTDHVFHVAEGAYDIDISNNVIVWGQLGNMWDIWGYDLIQQEEFPIITRPGSQTGPLVSGHWVVYRDAGDNNDTNVALYAANLDTGEDVRVGTVLYSLQQYVPPLYAVDAPWVVWSTGTEWGTEATLYFYNLETRTTYSVPVEACFSSTSRPEYLALSENTLIFTCGQRMGYDIERDVFFSLPIRTPRASEGGIGGWAISGNRLMWIWTKDAFGPQEQSHIYTAQIERSP
jgi:hypothetical protein